MLIKHCLLLIITAVSSQVQDWSSFIPIANIRELPNIQQGSYFENNRPHITEQTIYKTIYKDDTTKTQDIRRYNSQTTQPFTTKPLSFSSFIDVPSSSDDNRQFFTQSRSDQSSQDNARDVFNQMTKRIQNNSHKGTRTNERNPYERPQDDRYDTTRTEYYNSGDSRTKQNGGNEERAEIDENREAITNRPPVVDGIVFREDDDEPELIIGPDEELLSESKRRQVLRRADSMCTRYSAEKIETVAAIPLLPSPEPVTVEVERCTPENVPLVVGGEVTTIQEHPHMAAIGWPILRGQGYAWKCGGSLVSERYVLTAAHCTYQDRDNTVAQGPPRVVQLGSAFLSDPEATLVRVSAAIRHPKYKSPIAYYDISLLRLVTNVRLSERIRPACLGEPPSPGQNIIATGWGRTEFGGVTSEQLRRVSLPVWDVSECARALGTSRKLPNGADPRAQMCAGELRGGKDTCQGDSGGPAVVGSPCLWRVVGVTSLGRACGAPRTPALYARSLPEFVAAVIWL